MNKKLYDAVLLTLIPIVREGLKEGLKEGVKDGAKDEAKVASRAAISKAKEVTQEAFRKANKEAQAAIAKLLYKDSDKGSVRLLFVTSGLEAFEVKQVQEALEKGLNSSWRLQKLSKSLDHSLAEFKCIDYEYKPETISNKIPDFIKQNPFIAHVQSEAMEKALNLFQERYAEGVAKSIQMIYMYMFDDGDIFFTELGQPEAKPYSLYV